MTEPKHKEKYTLEEVKEFPPKFLARLIRQGKQYLKTDPVMLEVFREYDVPIEEIDYIPTMFSDIDVSARTDHGVIYLNYKLLCDGDFFKDFSYLTHEYTHWLQQTTGVNPTQGADDGDYLDNPYEVEGFQNQIEWMGETLGADEAEDYVDNMLSYHGLEGKEKKEKKEELTEKL